MSVAVVSDRTLHLRKVVSMRRILRTVGLLIAVAVALLLGVGAIWEQVERQHAVRDFPAPGRLVDIGGRRIQIDCRGTGSPAVVFESGLDINGSLSWTKVQDEVAKFTRACAYSRAGIIWSDDKDGPHDGVGVARDLHATLAAANEKGAFVLVGHSLGGLYITIYTKLYGDEVAGLVYVDASHPDQQKRMEAALGRLPGSSAMVAVTRVALRLRWTGVVRLEALLLLGGHTPLNVPSETVKISTVFASKSAAAAIAEMDSRQSTAAEAGTFRNLGARPVAVLTHNESLTDAVLKRQGMSKLEGEKLNSLWLDLQNDIASWSSRSTHRVLNDAGHLVQFDRPDAVMTAIREVVDGVRSEASR
jgi:pimeloyl-ACP methyl ester carboxylesterase